VRASGESVKLDRQVSAFLIAAVRCFGLLFALVRSECGAVLAGHGAVLSTTLGTRATAWAHVEVLSEMLGHASMSFTLDRYGHLYRGDAHTYVDRLA
jgi:hypothetical protein